VKFEQTDGVAAIVCRHPQKTVIDIGLSRAWRHSL